MTRAKKLYKKGEKGSNSLLAPMVSRKMISRYSRAAIDKERGLFGVSWCDVYEFADNIGLQAIYNGLSIFMGLRLATKVTS